MIFDYQLFWDLDFIHVINKITEVIPKKKEKIHSHD